MKIVLWIVLVWQVVKIFGAPTLIGKEKPSGDYDAYWYIGTLLQAIGLGLICLYGLGYINF